MAGLIQIIQGAQYGSEAKGAIAAYLCQKEEVDIAVRTGATNAGHTVIYRGNPVKMQQLPVGFVNPNTQLIIGAGAMVDIDILRSEVEQIQSLTGVNPKNRLIIDYRAGIHYPLHADRSKAAGRHYAIGATGKGCSEAIIDKIRRRSEIYGSQRPRIIEEETDLQGEFDIGDTEFILNSAYDKGRKIQLEGTQGTLLDLHLGPYPYTTHKQTGPAQWMMEAGLSPALRTDIVMVARTYPIRVAGNSGPLPFEMSWLELAYGINEYLEVNSGLPPLVSYAALREFEDAVRKARSSFNVPTGSDGLDQHRWSPAERVEFKEALSELNASALRRMSHGGLAELSKLFELTTVTKKLRRIARWDSTSIQTALRQIRPHRTALTFLNYWCPENWGSANPDLSDQEMRTILTTQIKLDFVTRGPGPEHVIAVK